ncbi:MAG: hypothetical protein O7C61_07880 [SAR324 cluster bacterium]|nr:hypothetical protein [SAR324 cluster bacterium]
MAAESDALMDNAAPGEDASESGGDGFDKLLEERFGPTHRNEMAVEIARHDQGRAPESFDAEHVRGKLRFHGSVPERVRAVLKEWLPGVLAFAAQSGLRLRDLNHEIHFYDRPSYEAATGPIPKGVKLPASSQHFNQLYRVYTVRVVLPDRISTVSQLLTVLRAVLARLLGDIFLREEIFTLEAYREDLENTEQPPSSSLAEKIKVLAQSGTTHPSLETALEGYGQVIHVNYRRTPDQVRKAYFQDTEKQLEQQSLPPEREQLIETVFESFLEDLRIDLPGAIGVMVEKVEKLHAQLNFLPADELPEYLRLRDSNPLHYLRSTHLRLNFLLEVLGTFSDLYEDLENPAVGLSPMVEQQIDGYLMRMRTENLARPYLIPDAQLSDELQQKKAAFPFEVHALLERMPPSGNPDKAFKSLSNRISNSIYQRLYTALMLIDLWGKQRDQGRSQTFMASGRFQTLRGLLANFRFRRPLLEALYIEIGVVLDYAESAGGEEVGRSQDKRFPLDGFARAWSHLIPHVLIAGFFARKGNVKGFDPGKYWEGAEESLRLQVGGSPGPYHLAYCLRQIHAATDGDGIAALLDLLRNPSGTFRFTVKRALAAPPEGQADSVEARMAQLDKWADVVVQARAASLANAIMPGQP